GRRLVLTGLVAKAVDRHHDSALGLGQLEQIMGGGRGGRQLSCVADVQRFAVGRAGGQRYACGDEHDGLQAAPKTRGVPGIRRGRRFHCPTWNVVDPPVILSIVVMESRPPPRSTMLMLKLSVSRFPGISLPSSPTMREVAEAARRPRMERSSVSWNISRGDCWAVSYRSSSASGSVCV